MNIYLKNVSKKIKNFKLVCSNNLNLLKEIGHAQIYKILFFTIISSFLEIFSAGLFISFIFKNYSIFRIINYQLYSYLNNIELLIIFLFLIIIRGYLLTLINFSKENLKIKYNDKLRRNFLELIISSSHTDVAELSRSKLIGSLITNISMCTLSIDQSLRLIQYGISLIIYVIFLLGVKSENLYFLLIAIIATLIASLFQKTDNLSIGRIQNQINSSIQKTVGDGLYYFKTLKAYRIETNILKDFEKDIKFKRKLINKITIQNSVFSSLRESFVIISLISWILLRQENFNRAELITIIAIAYKISNLTASIINAFRMATLSNSGYEELVYLRNKLLSLKTILLPTNKEFTNFNLSRTKEINYKCIDDKRNNKKIILKKGDLNLVSGKSGAGKTTLLDMFTGLLNPENGIWNIVSENESLNLTGYNCQKFLGDNCSYSIQNTTIFEGNIFYNLFLEDHNDFFISKITKRKISLQEIISWLKRLNLYHIFNKGNNFLRKKDLSEQSLSGGEINRLGLLRTWLIDHPIEVLDEPTAFQDDINSNKIIKIIIERSKKKIVFVSSHDFSLIKVSSNTIKISEEEGLFFKDQYYKK